MHSLKISHVLNNFFKKRSHLLCPKNYQTKLIIQLTDRLRLILTMSHYSQLKKHNTKNKSNVAVFDNFEWIQ